MESQAQNDEQILSHGFKLGSNRKHTLIKCYYKHKLVQKYKKIFELYNVYEHNL